MKVSSHYSRAFQKEDFYDTVQYLAKNVCDLFDELKVGYPILCYSGFSGITSATLLAYFIQQRMRVEQLYVRKPNESSHGSHIEYSTRRLNGGVLIFVDDFVETGETLSYVTGEVNKWIKSLEKNSRPQPFNSDCKSILEFDCIEPNVPYVLTGEFAYGDCYPYSIDFMKEQWYNNLINEQKED